MRVIHPILLSQKKTPVSPTPLVRTGWDTGICLYFVSGFLLKVVVIDTVLFLFYVCQLGIAITPYMI